MILGAEGHGARAVLSRAGVTAVRQVQKARGDEQCHGGETAWLAVEPEQAEACVCTHKGGAKGRAHALRLTRNWALRLQHVGRQVARAEAGGLRPAVAFEDSEESPSRGQSR